MSNFKVGDYVKYTGVKPLPFKIGEVVEIPESGIEYYAVAFYCFGFHVVVDYINEEDLSHE